MCTAMRGVVLLFLLSLWPGGNVDAIDPQVLANVVQQMRGFGLEGREYAMAVILTHEQCNGNAENFDENPKVVQDKLIDNTFYTGNRLIAATPHNGDHAEYRLLSGDNINPSPMQTLINNADQNARRCIVFFSTYSPCLEKCNFPNGETSILPFMNVFNGWNANQKAFVFSSVWDPSKHHTVTKPPRQDVLKSFRRIEQHIPLYRCVTFQQNNRWVNRCYQCITDPNPLTNLYTDPNDCLYGY